MNILASLRLIYIVAIKFPHVDCKKFSIIHDKCGMSPIMGVVLMVLLTIVLAGITVSAVYSDDIANSLSSAPFASIEVIHVEGGMPHQIRFDQNYLYIVHKGGDPLPAASTKIVITGEGSGHTRNFIGGMDLYGDVLISYDNLLFDGKESAYKSKNTDLSDGMWSVGEELILNGQDAINGGPSSTVSLSVNGFTNTSKNYGLKSGSTVTVKVFDIKTQLLIAECECEVTPAE
jgi:FlaG/FlaF family flagellin (archaellin)